MHHRNMGKTVGLSFLIIIGLFAVGTFFAKNTSEPVTMLEIKDEVIGSGKEARAGDTVEVHYVGTFTDGTKFDSSYDKNQPYTFTLGAGEVIRGWDVGVAGMKVGGKRKLTIPPSLGYGKTGSPPIIPGNATLVFEVQLLGIKEAEISKPYR